MPVQINGQTYDAAHTITWLTQGGMLQQSALDYFLQHCDTTYTASQQNWFIADLQAMVTPKVPGDYFRTPGVKAVRELYQDELLQQVLNRMNGTAADGQVKFTYVPDIPPIDVTRTLLVSEKWVGLSQQGATDLYTGGFAGCLGILFTPIGAAKGGVLVHVSQMGAAAGYKKDDYYIESIDGVMNWARACQHAWDRLDITLLIGQEEGTNIEFPDLPAEIRQRCLNKDKIRNIMDLRPFRDRAGQFLYKSHDKVLCLLKNAPVYEPVGEAMAEWTDNQTVGSTKLTFKSSTVGLSTYNLQ